MTFGHSVSMLLMIRLLHGLVQVRDSVRDHTLEGLTRATDKGRSVSACFQKLMPVVTVDGAGCA